MKPENIGNTFRQFIPMGINPMLENFIDKVNFSVDGGQLLQAAIHCKQAELVKQFIERGANLSSPPNKVPPLQFDPDVHVNYRPAPFIVQAACAGDKKVMQILIENGCSLHEVGHIALSKRHKNSLAHNVIGAAAYHGHHEVLEYCLKNLPADQIDLKGIETSDREKTSSTFKPEMQEFTPLQLAMVTPHANPSVVKLLFGRDADHFVKQATTGNNILHLVAQHTTDNNVLEYVVKNAKVSAFDRNKSGDTPLTICQAKGNADGVRIIE